MHALPRRSFNFTDEQFHNLGIGWDATAKKFKDMGRWVPVPIGAKNPMPISAHSRPRPCAMPRSRLPTCTTAA